MLSYDNEDTGAIDTLLNLKKEKSDLEEIDTSTLNAEEQAQLEASTAALSEAIDALTE
jgi:hypothetical protein